MREQISRDGYSDHERGRFDSRYYECYDHKSVKSSASVKVFQLAEYYISLRSFSSTFSCLLYSMLRFDGKSASFSSFIRNFEMYISKRIDPMLRIHYLIFACKGEPAESIERCVLLDPEQGSIEDLRILETTHGNPGRISEVSVSLQTKDLYSRRKTIKSSMSLPYSDSN